MSVGSDGDTHRGVTRDSYHAVLHIGVWQMVKDFAKVSSNFIFKLRQSQFNFLTMMMKVLYCKRP
jgi:hypothetical protein